MPDRVGEQIGNYRLAEFLGRGGFAEVYLATHLYLKEAQPVAIKILNRLQPEDQEQFLREANLVEHFTHKGIIKLKDYGVDETGEVPFLIMEYARRGSLRKMYPRGTKVSPLDIVSYVKQIAAALDYAHSKKIIHRDIKPENLLLRENGEIVVSDFGVFAVVQSTTIMKTSAYVGSVLYSPPEQFRGKVRPESDQYALGIVVYEWLCGAVPFSGGTQVEIALKHLEENPPSLQGRILAMSTDKTRAVEAVVMRALAKNPKDRFESVTAFADALETAITEETVKTIYPFYSIDKMQNDKINAKKNNAFRFKPWMIGSGIAILALLFASIYLALPGNLANACVSTFLDVCGNGLGTYPVSIGRDVLKLGIIDENSQDSFNIDTRENNVEKLIFRENKEADKGEHFTLLLATTLGKTAQDPLQSAFVGKEELAGVYIAQEEYNKQHPAKKLRLVIANLGVKDFASETVPQMIRNIALFAKKAPAQDHFMGVIGFPFSTVLQSALPFIHTYGLPVVSSSASSDDFDNKLPELHRIIIPNSQQNPALLWFIKNILRAQNSLVIVDSNDDYAKSLGGILTTSLTGNGMRQKTVPFADTSVFNGILDDIQAHHYDMVFCACFPNELIVLKGDMQARGLSFPIVGGQALYEVGAYENTVGVYQQLFFTASLYPDAQEKRIETFQSLYQTLLDPHNKCPGTYGCSRMGPHAAAASDAVSAFTNALSLIKGDVTRDTVEDALQRVSFDGVSGHVVFNNKNSNPTARPIYLLCADEKGDTQLLFMYNPDGTMESFKPVSGCY